MGPIKAQASYKKEVPTETWLEWKKEKKARKAKKREKLLSELDKQKEAASEISTEIEPTSQEESKGRSWTLSIALPGNILDNAQTPELRSALAGQIARAAAIFNVDEIVVFNEHGSLDKDKDNNSGLDEDLPPSCLQLSRILQYLECPQYLRKYFFPIHQDLRHAGLLNPLDAPNHYRRDDKAKFREGYVTEKVKKSAHSMVDVGLQRPIPVDTQLTPGLRVTVEIEEHPSGDMKKLQGRVVPPSTPVKQEGTYWGYSVRCAPSLGAVFTQCPYDEGYDLLVGTSERGDPVPKCLPSFKHILVTFGGLRGLELGLESDESLKVDDPSMLFDFYLNTCPGQGSRTIRTEEALLVTLAALQPAINSANF
ncbi:putative methyltransferase C9orf114 [Neocloeon triangulifer]|uniref:putative methyltransferase C9orf114 n=1 Tax=Neocloeon triangulifer TaxID=2078957 RepID=UPI00286F54C4|nr:putative methyltransferase C9orf114 [Neocloeon triangulifer]